MVNALLLVAGMFFDSTTATLLVIPIIAGPLHAAGVDPVHLGIVAIFNLSSAAHAPDGPGAVPDHGHGAGFHAPRAAGTAAFLYPTGRDAQPRAISISRSRPTRRIPATSSGRSTICRPYRPRNAATSRPRRARRSSASSIIREFGQA